MIVPFTTGARALDIPQCPGQGSNPELLVRFFPLDFYFYCLFVLESEQRFLHHTFP